MKITIVAALFAFAAAAAYANVDVAPDVLARSVTDELMAMESGRMFAPAWQKEKKNGDHPSQRTED